MSDGFDCHLYLSESVVFLYRLPGVSLSSADCRLSDVAVGGCCQFLVVECRVSVVGCRLSGVGCRSVFSLSVPTSAEDDRE
jgi:hypothetical protein